MKQSQFALEFTVLIAFMLLLFLGFFAVTSSRVLDAKDEENRQIAEDLANLVFEEIKLANSVEDGYSRVFNIPRKVKGASYNVSIIENRELVANYRGNEHLIFLPDNVVGNVSVGVNEIRRIDNIVYLSHIAECDDGIDNDGDSLIDLVDAGCSDSNDNDESNCGDNVCEGFESCLFCPQDCGGACFVPGKFILKASSNAMSIDNNGNVILKGTFQDRQNNIQPSGQDEFLVKDSLDNIVASVKLNNGNMKIKGNLFIEQATLSPSDSSDDFVIINSNGEVISYIDESGNFYLKGLLTQNGNP
jgi:hypothetical protein